MKLIESKTIKGIEIKTDEEFLNKYRKIHGDYWEMWYGDGWEHVEDYSHLDLLIEEA